MKTGRYAVPRLFALSLGILFALSLAGYAQATPCGFDYIANLTQYFNGSQVNFMVFNQSNGSMVFVFDNTTLNVSDNSTVNLTTESDYFYLNVTTLCDTKTFFIINVSQSYYEVTPNSTFNLSFMVSPVHFGNYSVSSNGVMNFSSTTTYIDAPKLYNYTLNFPVVTSGLYYQTFKIANGEEVQYLNFIFNNTIYPEPRLMKFDFPAAMVYGKDYNVSVFGDNIENATVFVGDQSFLLQNSSSYFFTGMVYTMKADNQIVLQLQNGLKSVNTTYTTATSQSVPSVHNMILPAVKINQSSRFLLVDFGVDHPIALSIASVASVKPNQTADFAYYIANEDGSINPSQAKMLYLYLTPQTANTNVVSGNFSSELTQSGFFRVEFVGSQFTNLPDMNLTYYQKPTACHLVNNDPSDPTNSSYDCHFSLPSTVSIENYQFNELQSMKASYEATITAKDNEIANDNFWIWIARFMVIAAVVSIALARYGKNLIFWWQARGK